MTLALPVQAICQDFDIPTIPAGGSSRINFPGTFIYNPGTAPVNVALDAGARFLIRAGAQYNCPDGTSFRQVVIYNQTAGAVKVTLTLGQGRITSVAPPTIERPTLLVGSATVSIPPAGSVSFLGSPTALLAQRKTFFCTNNDPLGGQQITLRSAAGVGGVGVNPQMAIGLDTSGEVVVFNGGVGAVSVLIAENWYTTA